MCPALLQVEPCSRSAPSFPIGLARSQGARSKNWLDGDNSISCNVQGLIVVLLSCWTVYYCTETWTVHQGSRATFLGLLPHLLRSGKTLKLAFPQEWMQDALFLGRCFSLNKTPKTACSSKLQSRGAFVPLVGANLDISSSLHPWVLHSLCAAAAQRKGPWAVPTYTHRAEEHDWRVCRCQQCHRAGQCGQQRVSSPCPRGHSSSLRCESARALLIQFQIVCRGNL